MGQQPVPRRALLPQEKIFSPEIIRQEYQLRVNGML